MPADYATLTRRFIELLPCRHFIEILRHYAAAVYADAITLAD